MSSDECTSLTAKEFVGATMIGKLRFTPDFKLWIGTMCADMIDDDFNDSNDYNLNESATTNNLTNPSPQTTEITSLFDFDLSVLENIVTTQEQLIGSYEGEFLAKSQLLEKKLKDKDPGRNNLVPDEFDPWTGVSCHQISPFCFKEFNWGLLWEEVWFCSLKPARRQRQ